MMIVSNSVKMTYVSLKIQEPDMCVYTLAISMDLRLLSSLLYCTFLAIPVLMDMYHTCAMRFGELRRNLHESDHSNTEARRVCNN